QTGRVANFEKAATGETSGHEGWFFNDSDVYKVIEGAAYHLAVRRDPALEARLDGWIEKIGAVQRSDGYLNTYFQLNPHLQRWTQDQFHELYCAGTLIEAGIAYHRATGKRRLLEIALRNAECVHVTFRPGRKAVAPEHPEIELALIKLAQHAGEARHRELAQFFVEQRGRCDNRPTWKQYAQDHLPIRAQTEVVGHAVRAFYLYCAVADLAATGDEGYRRALDALWRDLTTRKMYITGGTGVWGYDEGFAPNFELPNERAYAETCASIALAFWAQRMNRLHADARYMDVFERVLYNAIAAGVSLDGEKYLYANPLASHGPEGFATSGGAQGGSTSHRQHWFRCACCPPNVLRFFAALPSCACAFEDAAADRGAQTPGAVYVNLYIAGQAQIPLAAGNVALRTQTEYPWDGVIRIEIVLERPQRFDLHLRLPDWCEAPALRVNGAAVTPGVVRGYARLAREWRPGETVELDLPMPVRRVECRPRVAANAGRVALQRGPLVYCVEAVDNPGGVWNLALPHDAEMHVEKRPDLLGGVTALRGTALQRGPEPPHAWRNTLYRHQSSTPPAVTPVEFVAVPYCVWDNRTPGAMAVWLPQDPAAAEPAEPAGL
ncbi:MAG: beta-L-arabinofuranosidase domain-containing protein, partial [Planctomycetota bacterium]